VRSTLVSRSPSFFCLLNHWLTIRNERPSNLARCSIENKMFFARTRAV
jgi:hypothetical protein